MTQKEFRFYVPMRGYQELWITADTLEEAKAIVLDSKLRDEQEHSGEATWGELGETEVDETRDVIDERGNMIGSTNK